MTREAFQQILSTLPAVPGIYKYFDAEGELLYVGKAKNIRKRVSSYFQKTPANYKTYELVQKINQIAFTIVDSEQDAFLLENSLIKQFKPKYNIVFKDDKTYPFIVIKNEPFPRVFLTRKKINDGSEYLGPFTSVGKVRELMEFIRQYIPLRTCKLNLDAASIARKKFKVCLEYHLGNCKGPCEALQSAEDYEEGLQQVKQLLKGNLQPVIKHLKQEMQQQANQLEFEKAEQTKKKIEHLENYQARSVIVSKQLTHVDVFSIWKQHEAAYVNYLMVENGVIVLTHTEEFKTPLEESETNVLSFAIMQLREIFNSKATEVVVPFPVELPSSITITIPRGGDKKKLLALSQKNVNYFQYELKKKKLLPLTPKHERILQNLQKDLQLPELPVHIECFDNSNFQGSFPVAAMVCFKNGIPSKKDYRHFHIKTVQGINDFASMKEIVYRRYKRLKEEGSSLPQFIIIDGGKGQLNAAAQALSELGLAGRTTIVGLAKNEEEIFFPHDKESVKLAWQSESLNFIRSIRNEVHRFAIEFHRKQRSKKTLVNELEQIEGIGQKTALKLLQHFRSVRKIQEASLEELTKVIGAAKSAIVWNQYHASTQTL